MKIAYVFTGHLRTAIENDTLLPRLIEPNPGDIFIHTYRHRNAPTQTWHGDMAGAGRDAAPDLAWVLATYPNVIAAEMESATGGHEHAPTPAMAKAAPARWSSYRAQAMRREHENRMGFRYDLVFCARFDLWLGEVMKLEAPAPRTFYGSHFKHDAADGDVFGYGGSDEMLALAADPFPALLQDIAAAARFEGEQVSTSIRKALGFDFRVHPVHHGLLRSTGVFVVA